MNTYYEPELTVVTTINLKRVVKLLFLLTIILLSGKAFAGDVSLSWDPSPSTNVGGYKIYYGTASKTYTKSIKVGNKTTYQITGLANGTYYFAVKAYNIAETIESSFSNEISVNITSGSTVNVDFSGNQTTGNVGMVVVFAPSVNATVSQWLWDFGDGQTSTAQKPTHTYNVAGSYDVSLTVTVAGVKTTKTAPDFIQVQAVASAPVADFTPSATTGDAPKTIVFTDTSTGNITSRLWKFGDGTTSTAQNPSHTFTTPNTYAVSLTVTGPNGTDVKSTSIVISKAPIDNPPVVGLVAAYNFEGANAAVVNDMSGNGNNGSVFEATQTPAGHFGKAMKFDGVNDMIKVNDSASLHLSRGFTIEAWVNPMTIQRSSVLFKKQLDSDADFALYAYEDADLFTAELDNGSTMASTSGHRILPINTWTHLAASYDGTTLRLYRNGNASSSFVTTGLVKQSNGQLQIGGNDALGEFFKGSIDDVRIYNKALTQVEIQADLSKPVTLTGNDPGTGTVSYLGNKTLEPAVDSNTPGSAEAFTTTPQKTGSVTELQIYLDASSKATTLVAGIYTDVNGHPGALLAQGKLTTPKAGSTNTVTIPSTDLTAGKAYWIALLSPQGEIRFRDRLGSGVSALETCAINNLTSLPAKWVTDAVFPKDGPVSAYGVIN